MTRRTPSSEEDRRKLLAALLSLAMLGGMLWVEIPEHRRKELLMKATRTVATTSSRLALRVAGREMQVELRGGRPGYELPYWLGLLRDHAGRAYERLRTAS